MSQMKKIKFEKGGALHLGEWWGDLNQSMPLHAFSVDGMTRIIRRKMEEPPMVMEWWSIKYAEQVSRVDSKDMWKWAKTKEMYWRLMFQTALNTAAGTSVFYLKNFEVSEEAKKEKDVAEKLILLYAMLKPKNMVLVTEGFGVWEREFKTAIGVPCVELINSPVEEFMRKADEKMDSHLILNFEKAWQEEREGRALKASKGLGEQQSFKRAAL
jgi:diacylglycerol kinase